ncbi:MAG: polymer-forming cytoskeletal protein [Rhodomicrobium sp.]
MTIPIGKAKSGVLRLDLDRRLTLQFLGSAATLIVSIVKTTARSEELEGDEMGQKYELVTTDTRMVRGATLNRIRRKSDGLLGGYVETEANLSQSGTCWLHGQSTALGNASTAQGNARVSENAQVHGEVYGDAIVSGNATVQGSVYGDAIVSGNATVQGSVFDQASVSGNAKIAGRAYGHAIIRGDAQVNGEAFGSAIVEGAARVNGRVYGTAHLSGNEVVKGDRSS